MHNNDPLQCIQDYHDQNGVIPENIHTSSGNGKYSKPSATLEFLVHIIIVKNKFPPSPPRGTNFLRRGACWLFLEQSVNSQ
jgi:hypothetical protein